MMTPADKDRLLRKAALWGCIVLAIVMGYLTHRGIIKDVWLP